MIDSPLDREIANLRSLATGCWSLFRRIQSHSLRREVGEAYQGDIRSNVK